MRFDAYAIGLTYTPPTELTEHNEGRQRVSRVDRLVLQDTPLRDTYHDSLDGTLTLLEPPTTGKHQSKRANGCACTVWTASTHHVSHASHRPSQENTVSIQDEYSAHFGLVALGTQTGVGCPSAYVSCHVYSIPISIEQLYSTTFYYICKVKL